jgi:hypothetical protein
MGAAADFFSNLANGVGGTILPSAYLQGQGIDPSQQQPLQRAALGQLGMGLLSSIGTGQPFGERLGQAFNYAGTNANQQVRQIVKEQGDKEAMAIQKAHDAAQQGQWNTENALRQGQFEAQKSQFKATLDQNQAQLEQAKAHETAMEGIARTSASAEAANAASEAAIRRQQLEQTVAQQKAIQAILDEPGPLTDDKIKRIQVQNLKFSGGAFTPPSLAQQIAQAFGGAPLGGAAPGQNPPGTMPSVQQILAAGQRPPGQ